MGLKIEQWTAKATGSDGDRVITVRGEGESTSCGYVLSLEPTNEGIVPDPDVLALKLVIEEPELGGQAITEVSVEDQFHDPAVSVRISTPEGLETVDVAEA